MRIAFVGIEKDWADLEKRDYTEKFIKHHLELPYYYAVHGKNDVIIVSKSANGLDSKHDYVYEMFGKDFSLTVMSEELFLSDENEYSGFDVVVHWRKWTEECYRPEAINVINSQDHSYSIEWLDKVEKATAEGKLKGILCFPEWHHRRLALECSNMSSAPPLMPGVTLGVDTQVYKPSKNKNRHGLLWASDPGRGVGWFQDLTSEVFKRDHKFKSSICQPDYVNTRASFVHPAFDFYSNLDNGPELWNLFNESGFLPYTSTFEEPSSRAHRQAMAAGCVVLYPPNMGTPSDLITDNVDGFVRPLSEWVDIITRLSSDKEEFDRISQNAREHAIRENWEVQANRFNELFKELIK